MAKPWKKLQRADTDPRFARNPEQQKVKQAHGLPDDDEIWVNDLYQVVVRYMKPTEPEPGVPEGRDGMIHLSIHLHTRDPIRNWRHLQAIKNEVAGEDRWAFETFPPEKFLVDTSNEYHLYVMPKGADLGFGFHERLVSSDDQAEAYNDAPHKGKQEPWEPGISTGGARDKNDPRLRDDGSTMPVEPKPAKRPKGIVG